MKTTNLQVVLRDGRQLAAVWVSFSDAFGVDCFYRCTHLPPNNPIDRVSPWLLVDREGLANLVLDCARCNGSKSGSPAPAAKILDRDLTSDRVILENTTTGSSSARRQLFRYRAKPRGARPPPWG